MYEIGALLFASQTSGDTKDILVAVGLVRGEFC